MVYRIGFDIYKNFRPELTRIDPFLFIITWDLGMLIVFFILYYLFYRHYGFVNPIYLDAKRIMTNWDIFMLSATTQSGVGITNIYPKTDVGTFLLTLQQVLMLVGKAFIVSLLAIAEYN